MKFLDSYPKKHDATYYVEFSRWDDDEPLRWTLYKTNYIMSEEEWKKHDMRTMLSREGHPWNLGGGEVNDHEHVISMHTEKFLMFMVDSLNKNSNETEV